MLRDERENVLSASSAKKSVTWARSNVRQHLDSMGGVQYVNINLYCCWLAAGCTATVFLQIKKSSKVSTKNHIRETHNYRYSKILRR